MVLVAGATGLLGSEVCKRLRRDGTPTRALVRQTSDKAKLDRLSAMGVEFAYGDLREKETLGPACAGVDAVITGASSIANQKSDLINAVDRDGQLSLVDAAREQGVRHFVYVSLSEHIDADTPLLTAKKLVEDRIMASGMSWTVLGPSYFMDYWLSPILWFNPATAQARIYGSGDQKVSWITAGDVAEFAIRSPRVPAARNRRVEIGGPEALSPREVIRIYEGFMGRPFAVEQIPLDAVEAQWASATDPLMRSLSGLMLGYARGDVVEMSKTQPAFGFPMETVSQYAERLVTSLGAAAH
jgi:uncharacterized protein YbjT (DUF2867 family)